MELLANLQLGFGVALTLQNMLYCFAGVLLGTLIGVLPGIGPVATIAMLLPATYALPPVSALIMLAGIYYGAQYGGSTTAILVNIPGESSSVVTCLDGYAMAREGRAGAALAVAALGSFFAGTVGTLMLLESSRAIQIVKRDGRVNSKRAHDHSWVHWLPWKMRFRRSKLYISAVPPLVIGAFVGFLAAVMGIGGGFVIVPALIYLLRVPTNVAVGTSLFQVVFVTAATTMLQAATNQTVDAALAFFLVVGGVVGAELGAAAGEKLHGEQLRFWLGALVLLVGMRVGYDLVVKPAEMFSLQMLTRGSR